MQRYTWQPFAAALCFLALLLSNVGLAVDGKNRFVFWVANAAYSLYLTHALAIHGAGRIGRMLAGPGEAALYYAVAVVLIVGSGAAFFVLVERPSINLRERLSPNRSEPSRQKPAAGGVQSTDAALARHAE
jgi:peptidoglycan/LPS O-acetylase OafA/YrhL